MIPSQFDVVRKLLTLLVNVVLQCATRTINLLLSYPPLRYSWFVRPEVDAWDGSDTYFVVDVVLDSEF